LTGNIVCQITNSATPGLSIIIDLAKSAQTGGVVLDFQGDTISASKLNNASGVLVQSNPTISRIIIKNGTLQGFGIGIDLNNPGNLSANYLLNAHVENMTLNGDGGLADLRLSRVNSSTITDCTFNASEYGILDTFTLLSNSYSNNSFHGSQTTLIAVSNTAGPLVTGHCQFQASPSN
jgi:hypothetical protein